MDHEQDEKIEEIENELLALKTKATFKDEDDSGQKKVDNGQFQLQEMKLKKLSDVVKAMKNKVDFEIEDKMEKD